MKIIGLTGSIGMGKTTTAGFFRQEGVPVHDADAVVHALYRGEAAPLVEAAFPGTTDEAGVNRQKLGPLVMHDPQALKRLEALIHPLVKSAEAAAVAAARAEGHRLFILDIPLLFETGADKGCDAIVVVSAPPHVQKARVMAREGMTEEKFTALIARQTPDAEKRRRAHFVIDTSLGPESARRAVRAIIRALSA